MPKLLSGSVAKASGKTEIRNLRLLDVGVEAEATSLVAQSGFKADPYRAYLEFEICHSLPEVAGPVQADNFIGYTADTLAISHQSLLHQQFNIRHLLKAYGTEENSVARDRIIGCVVATAYPRTPMGGWPKGEAVPVRAAATIFKLAEGVGKLLGDHLTSRQKQSVSIETTTNFGNIGVHRPSTGESWPLLDLPANVAKSLSEYKGSTMPHVGKLSNEQLVVLYGMGEPINLRGVGMTAFPAERAAKILGVQAERRELEASTLFTVSAQQQMGAMVGQTVKFKTGRVGCVVGVTVEGEARLLGTSLRMPGTVEDPALLIRFADRSQVLRRCSEVMPG